MITIFCDFCQFSAKKLAFFSKTNVMIKIFQKLDAVLAKNVNVCNGPNLTKTSYSSSKKCIFWRKKIVKIKTSVPGHGLTACYPTPVPLRSTVVTKMDKERKRKKKRWTKKEKERKRWTKARKPETQVHNGLSPVSSSGANPAITSYNASVVKIYNGAEVKLQKYTTFLATSFHC
jgi:hypothetical protein